MKIGDIMDYKITSTCEDDTIELAQNIESEKFPNMVLCLEGDLGSGKTLFTKAFAHSMQIEDNITSPTFNIIKEYQGDMKLFHMDVYRLDEVQDDIGIPEYFKKRGVTIIEWADLIPELLPKNRLEIKFKMIDENTRLIVLKPYGEKYEEVCNKVI